MSFTRTLLSIITILLFGFNTGAFYFLLLLTALSALMVLSATIFNFFINFNIPSFVSINSFIS